MRYPVILIIYLFIFCSGKSSKPEKIETPDTGFKYRIRFEKEKNLTMDEGNLSELKPLTVEDGTINQIVFNEFSELLYKSPKWKPAKENGQNIEANYIIALVWGHYRIVDTDNSIYKEAMELGLDPLSVLID
ncbi:MAG: hypothetical protein LIO79_08390 [Rikenellaceae bacterium]|nr:hypothetical protein [Rikenellaceae bacterium]